MYIYHVFFLSFFFHFSFERVHLRLVQTMLQIEDQSYFRFSCFRTWLYTKRDIYLDISLPDISSYSRQGARKNVFSSFFFSFVFFLSTLISFLVYLISFTWNIQDSVFMYEEIDSTFFRFLETRHSFENFSGQMEFRAGQQANNRQEITPRAKIGQKGQKFPFGEKHFS